MKKSRIKRMRRKGGVGRRRMRRKTCEKKVQEKRRGWIRDEKGEGIG